MSAPLAVLPAWLPWATMLRLRRIAKCVAHALSIDPPTHFHPDLDSAHPHFTELFLLLTHTVTGLAEHQLADLTTLGTDRVAHALRLAAARLSTSADFSAIFHHLRSNV